MPTAPNKLVPAAIHRKLDPALPGHDESISELEEIALPRFQVGFPPQRLVMTILGDYWSGRSEPIPSAALVRILGAFDIAEPAARVALARLVARGVLTLERRGRTSQYRQTPKMLTLLPQGHAITERFGLPRTGWNGTWTVLSWNVTNQSSALAHRVRTDLRELGFASVANGVWVSPDPPDDHITDVLSRSGDLRYTLFAGAAEVASIEDSPADAWDLGGIQSEYDDFLAVFRPVLRRARGKRFSDEEAFAARVRATYRWFVIATIDPDLPVELLPPNWPRVAARALFLDLVAATTLRAESFVRDVLAGFDPALADLVTSPPSYPT